jgi:hypothetical protein
LGLVALAHPLLNRAAMAPANMNKVLRDGLIGFGIGLVVMLAVSFGASSFGASPPAATTSAQ